MEHIEYIINVQYQHVQQALKRNIHGQHNGGEHPSGKCKACLAQYQTHGQSTTVDYYQDDSKVEYGHYKYYRCQESTCNIKYGSTYEVHQVEDCDDKNCVCGHNITHGRTPNLNKYEVVDNYTHILVYECSASSFGCNSTYKGEDEDHSLSYSYRDNGNGNHTLTTTCNKACGYKITTTAKHTVSDSEWSDNEDGETHSGTCSKSGCGAAVTEEHVYDNGECKCGATEPGQECEHSSYTKQKNDTHHWQECSSCGEEKEESRVAHTYTYTPNSDDETHTGTCECGATVQAEHSPPSNPFWLPAAGGRTHTITCECGATIEEPHYYENGACKYCFIICAHGEYENGICKNCGTVCAHNEYSGDGKCKECRSECNHTYDNGICTNCNHEHENHTGGTHPEGNCTVCRKLYEHSTTQRYEKDDESGTHTLVTECNECNYSEMGETEEHSAKFNAWYGIDKTGHTGICECSEILKRDHIYENGVCNPCGWICFHDEYENGTCKECGTICEHIEYDNGICKECEDVHTDHINGSHNNEGTCEICGYKYQEHGESTVVARYETSEDGHIPLYACKYTGCESTYTGEIENHKDGNHTNDGKCQVEGCGYQYQIHGKSTTFIEYDKNEEQHIPLYECTYSECETKCEGTPENHTVEAGTWTDNTNGTHTGECTVCTYELTREHEYNNDGVCSDCSATEPTEQCIHTYELEYNDTQHWEECSKCEQVKQDTLVVHTYGTPIDNGDETHTATCTGCPQERTLAHTYQSGECSECHAIEPEEECNHIYEANNDATQHWEECSKCKEIKEGSQENHTYGIPADNGNGTHSETCTECNYKITNEHDYQNGECSDCGLKQENKEDEECEHTYVTKTDSTQHWDECSKCKQVKTGTLAKHEFTKYINNANETHSAICADCAYVLVEEHDYESGKCNDCKAAEPVQDEECDHTYIILSDKNNHWAQCKKCGEVKSGTLEEHTIKYIDNKNGTHNAMCSECGHIQIETHKTDENCKLCGATGTTNTGSGSQNNSGSSSSSSSSSTSGQKDNSTTDNSIAGKDIPKAGIRSIITILAITFVAVCGFARLKMKKYKDIEKRKKGAGYIFA